MTDQGDIDEWHEEPWELAGWGSIIGFTLLGYIVSPGGGGGIVMQLGPLMFFGVVLCVSVFLGGWALVGWRQSRTVGRRDG